VLGCLLACENQSDRINQVYSEIIGVVISDVDKKLKLQSSSPQFRLVEYQNATNSKNEWDY
jgi:hypothetical protein